MRGDGEGIVWAVIALMVLWYLVLIGSIVAAVVLAFRVWGRL